MVFLILNPDCTELIFPKHCFNNVKKLRLFFIAYKVKSKLYTHTQQSPLLPLLHMAWVCMQADLCSPTCALLSHLFMFQAFLLAWSPLWVPYPSIQTKHSLWLLICCPFGFPHSGDLFWMSVNILPSPKRVQLSLYMISLKAENYYFLLEAFTILDLKNKRLLLLF